MELPPAWSAVYDGTTLLETSNFASGQATYTTAGLSSGAHNITATYGGDNNFNIATSGSSNITIL